MRNFPMFDIKLTSQTIKLVPYSGLRMGKTERVDGGALSCIMIKVHYF
jgi:hypothetical protein